MTWFAITLREKKTLKAQQNDYFNIMSKSMGDTQGAGDRGDPGYLEIKKRFSQARINKALVRPF